MPIGDTKDLINYINEQLNTEPEPGQDLGISLRRAMPEPRPEPDLHVRGFLVEDIPEPGQDTLLYDEQGLPIEQRDPKGQVRWRRGDMPRPNRTTHHYHCVCGATFKTLPELMEHRHPAKSYWAEVPT